MPTACQPTGSTKVKSREEVAIDTLLEQPAPLPNWRAYVTHARPPPPTEGMRPSANVPPEDLFNYWRRASLEVKADAETQKRLLELCEKNPEELFFLLPRFSEESTAIYDRLKALADRLKAEKSEKTAAAAQLVETWTWNHQRHTPEDLRARAFNAEKILEDPESALTELMQSDRRNTKPLLLKKAAETDVAQRTRAICALLQHFGNELTDKQRIRFKQELKSIGTDAKAPRDARQKAILQVMQDTSAKDQRWFLDLFRDPSLEIGVDWAVTTPLAPVVAQRPDYWVPRIVPLVGSKDRTTHVAAVYCLTQVDRDHPRADATRALLPWLANPEWAPDSERLHGRLAVLRSLENVDLPEAVPSLVKVLETAKGSELTAAANALERYQAKDAIEPLKRALAREKDPQNRSYIVGTLLDLGAFTRSEKIEALKRYAKKMSTPTGRAEMAGASGGFPSFIPNLELTLGSRLGDQYLGEEAMVQDIAAAAQQLEASDRDTADALRLIIAGWRTEPATKFLVEQLRSGNFTGEWLKAVADKYDIASCFAHVNDLKGAARGVQAALTGNQDLIRQTLDGRDSREQAALLAMARLKRTQLPLERVIRLLDAKDAQLARATDSYLEADDSISARGELWRRASGRARILGGKKPLEIEELGPNLDVIGQRETELRDLVISGNGPDEIYALLNAGSFRLASHIIVLAYKERVLLRCEDSNGRTRERELDAAEFSQLRDWLTHEKIDDLPAFAEGYGESLDSRRIEFLHISRARGRRVFMIDPPEFRDRSFRSDSRGNAAEAQIYGELIHRMNSLENAPMQVFYQQLNHLPGFQVIHRREEDWVHSLRVIGNQILAATHPSSGDYEWHLLTENGMSKERAPVPPERDPSEKDGIPNGFLDHRGFASAKAGPLRGRKIWAASRDYDGLEGLWSLDESGHIELLIPGHYGPPLLSPDGQWLVTDKFDRDGPNPWITVRIEAESRREEPVKVPAPRLWRVSPITWIDSLHRVLLCRMNFYVNWPPNLRDPQFLLLDPATGKFEETPLEFRPAVDRRARSLQPSKLADQCWSSIAERASFAINTTIGRYDTRHFRFEPVVQLKGVNLQNKDFVVDEEHGLIWMNSDGDVLRVALPHSTLSKSSALNK